MIINYDSNIINKFGASLPEDTRVIIYDRHMFIVQATGAYAISKSDVIYSFYCVLPYKKSAH